jgi:hypothetical protein
MNWNIYLEEIQKAIVYQELVMASIGDISLEPMNNQNTKNLINFLNKIGTKITFEQLLLIKYDKQKEEKEQLMQIRSKLDTLLKNKKFTDDELLSFKTFLETNCYFDSGYHYYFKVNSQVYSLSLDENPLDDENWKYITKTISFDKATNFAKSEGYKQNQLSNQELSILFGSIKSIIEQETNPKKDVYMWNPILQENEKQFQHIIDDVFELLQDLFVSYLSRIEESIKVKPNKKNIEELTEEINDKLSDFINIDSKTKNQFKKEIFDSIQENAKKTKNEMIAFLNMVYEGNLDKNIFGNKKYNTVTFFKEFDLVKNKIFESISKKSGRSRIYLRLIKNNFPGWNTESYSNGVLFSQKDLKQYKSYISKYL